VSEAEPGWKRATHLAHPLGRRGLARLRITALAGLLAWHILPAQGQPNAAPSVATGASSRAATASEAKPAWAALTVAQQSALAPLKPEWASIDAARKQKWLDMAARMPAMTAPERERIQHRMTEWVRMTPSERGRARVQFQEARQLPPSTRQQQWEAYQALPADKRQALRAHATQPKKSVEPSAQGGAGKMAGLPPRSGDPKRNIVSLTPPSSAPRAVAPTVVQTRPGATTSLVTTPSAPPAHHQAGLPKVNARAGFVDPATLLPRRGPQGAAAISVAPAGQGATSTP
jgi:Protein of unknown function (DUF3106)